MRTTVEMKPEHRTALLSLASRRGQKGFSAVLGDAIESYLGREKDREEKRRKILALRGSLSAEGGEKLRRATRALRAHWR